MNTYLKSSFFVQLVLIFVGIPLLILALSSFPERSWLKETISLLTILAFFLVVGQFFLSRSNGSAVQEVKMSRLISLHKVIGYTAVTILLIHPFLQVFPRFFEAGVSPDEAFITIITTFTSQGVVLGIIAWFLMLTLGIMSFMRNQLPMKYTTWRLVHGILSILFVFSGAWHMIDLGRHANLAMSVFIAVLTAGGVLLQLSAYRPKTEKVGVN
ncbi:MAG: ferric reductase-like transmembrane domain-containing protein [Desulfuromusa sp.]|jgi:predicted ferric reductase|nr:ferric reductase-like transmembrane domain-containing protein [Desulfuromusa sp.]